MRLHRTWQAGLFTLALLSGAQSWADDAIEKNTEAEEASPPTAPELPQYTLAVNGLTSDANDREVGARLIYRRSPKLTWEFRAGHVQIGTVPVFEFPFGRVGLRYSGQRAFFFSSLGHWGDTEVISSLDLDVGVGLNTARWNWEMGFQYRQIESDPVALTGDVIAGADGSAQGRTLFSRLQFKPTPTFAAYVGAGDTAYAIPNEALAVLFEQHLLGARSITLISQFPDWTWSAGMDFAFGPERLNVDYTVIQTLFRGLRPEIFSAAVTLPAGKRKQLVFRAGQRNTPGFSKVYFGVLAFSTSF